MNPNQVYLKLNLKGNNANRLEWNGAYFNLDAVLVLENKITKREQAQETLKNALLIIKMIPFQNEFKAKLFSHILGEEKSEKSSILAFSAKINVLEKKVLDILDMQETQGMINAFGETSLNPNESTLLKLTQEEKSDLFSKLQNCINQEMGPHITEPFGSLFPEILSPTWKDRKPQQNGKSTLVSYQALFPYCGTIERISKEEIYFLDDLYCVDKKCDCNQVNCFIFTFDPQSGKEVIMGGFQYNFQKKSFKNRADFPKQFNSQEWFKQFSANQPIDLSILFDSRYKFLRSKEF